METAALDACVLFRGGVRDFLLWVAEAGAFSPAWSDVIHEEWMRNRRDKFSAPVSRLNHARREMDKAFPGANFDPDPETLKAGVRPRFLPQASGVTATQSDSRSAANAPRCPLSCSRDDTSGTTGFVRPSKLSNDRRSCCDAKAGSLARLRGRTRTAELLMSYQVSTH